MSKKLDTGIKNVRNVSRYTIGNGSINELPQLIATQRQKKRQNILFLLDEFFQDKEGVLSLLGCEKGDELVFVLTQDEPSTDYINGILSTLQEKGVTEPAAVVGMGGGTTMDVAKAISNLLSNGGKAEDYQGWDLVKKPGIYKIAIPTLSGTGAEATRTCVMTNKKTGLKLGMNSDFTVYDQLILDPVLTKSVPRDQYFYTGMDAYIHCIESLNGSYRNAIGDAYSAQTISLCREVFISDNMMSDENRSKMMVASYLGGCAIATSYVGVLHPFSAGLSVVLGTHHCIANCITMRAMEEFYPVEYKEFWQMVKQQEMRVPEGICRNLSDEQYDQLYASTIIHEKPLINALGENFKEVLTKDKVIDIFKRM
jgi:3-deoxy-alpha-D-manno-octulosonate 8-oxidase